MKKIIVVSTTNYIKKYFTKLKKKKIKILFINKKSELKEKIISKYNPDHIFFVQWHWKVKLKILNSFNCIGFHETPLPFGRGGTPIQNMILRGFKKTKICALKISEKIDQGPIYLKKTVSLNGKGEEIMQRINKVISKMIIQLSLKKYKSKPQKGKATYFKRRKSFMSELPKNFNKIKLFDFIRMLDIDQKNFPKAFINYGKYKIILSSAKFKSSEIKFQGIIK